MKYIIIRYWFVLKSWFNSCTKALIMTSSVLVKLLFEKSQHLCNLYQRMLYWWNNCLKKKTHFTIYTKECCIGEITVWKKPFYNLYHGMLYWWNNCLKKIIFCNLYQWMLYWWNNCLKKTVYYLYQGMYRCTWFIGEITV